MSELKTLEDFKRISKEGFVRINSRDLVLKELKQEAIKHIRYLENGFKGCTNKTYIRGQINILKYFFNIIDEELR